MPNKLAVVVDHYLDITNQEADNYKKHLRAAKDLLELCEGDTNQACIMLDKTKNWISGLTDRWSIDLAVKKYIEFK